jgi:hypothetical protein
VEHLALEDGFLVPPTKATEEPPKAAAEDQDDERD